MLYQVRAAYSIFGLVNQDKHVTNIKVNAYITWRIKYGMV